MIARMNQDHAGSGVFIKDSNNDFKIKLRNLDYCSVF